MAIKIDGPSVVLRTPQRCLKKQTLPGKRAPSREPREPPRGQQPSTRQAAFPPSLSLLVTIAQRLMEATKVRGVTHSRTVLCCQLAVPRPRVMKNEHYSFLYLEFFFRVTKHKPGDGFPFQPSKYLLPLVLRQLSHTRKTPMN